MNTVLIAYLITNGMQCESGADMKKKKRTYFHKEKLAYEVADTLQLPKDLVFGAVILSITGQSEAYVENYRSIIEFSNEKIKLQTKTCQVEINGRNLQIEYYTNDEMKIVGCIDCIRYQR